MAADVGVDDGPHACRPVDGLVISVRGATARRSGRVAVRQVVATVYRGAARLARWPVVWLRDEYGGDAMRSYKSYDEFTREEIRPLTRVGFSIDEFDIDSHYQEDFLFDKANDDDDEDE